MPDMDQLLNDFVADVRSKTQAPGASMAIEQANHRRKVVAAVATVATVAVIAAASALAAGTLGGSDQLSPIGEPTTPPPTTAQESAEPTPKSFAGFSARLDSIFAQAPGWTITLNYPPDYDYAFNGPCSGNWTQGATSGGDGGIGPAGIGGAGFPSEAQASDAAARFVDNLESCTATAWRTQSIEPIGAVLASSADGAAWILQQDADVRVLQVRTTDGPPPVDVQVEVAELMVAYSAWQEQN